MRLNFYYLFVLFFMISCDYSITEENKPVNFPSGEDNHSLTEDEALNILTDFIANLPEHATRSSSETVNIKSCSKKKALDYINSAPIETRNNSEDSININSIPIYEFTTESETGEGFGIVIGDKRFNEVIAFSPKGSLSDTIFNEGLATYLSTIPALVYNILDDKNGQENQPTRADYWQPEQSVGYASYITDWDSETLVFSGSYDEACSRYPRYFSEWDEYDTPVRYVPVKWDQLSPYNNYVPIDCDGIIGKVGCGAVAIAQVMAFHKYPTNYNWSLITSSERIYPYQTAAANEVSRLMIDVATATNTRFGCKYDGQGGSTGSTYPTDYIPALNIMGYSATNLYSDREKVSSTMVRDCIVNYGPALMAAASHTLDGVRGSGHLWVIDGYYRKSRYHYSITFGWNSPTDMFGRVYAYRQHFVTLHCNWGWGGSSDGWYYIFQPVNERYLFSGFHLWNVTPNK